MSSGEPDTVGATDIFFSASPVAMAVVDRDLRLTQVNDAFARLTGRSRASHGGVGLASVVAPGAVANLENLCRQTLATGRAQAAAQVASEVPATPSEGSERWWLVNAGPVVQNDEVSAVVLVVVDITEQRRREAALLQRESTFRAVLAAAPIGVFLTDRHGDIVYANEAKIRMNGLTLDQTMGRGWFAALHPDDREGIIRGWEAMVVAGEPRVASGRYLWPDGSVHSWTVEISPIRTKGELIGFVGMVVDMTARRDIEEALVRSEARYRTLVYATAQVVWTTAADGQVHEPILDWQGLTGQTFEQVRGSGWLEAVHPDDRETNLQRWTDALATATTFECERRVRRSDGVWRYMFARAVPVVDATGAIREWVGADSDVTERKQAERALQQQEVDLQLITAAVPVRIAYIDTAQRYRFVNAAYASIGPLNRLIGKTIAEVQGPTAYARLEPFIRAALEGQTVHFETELGEAPEERFLSVSYVPRISSAGVVLGFHAISNDVTEQRRLQDQLHHSQKLEAVGRLAGGVAHDFNNLLTVILSYASLLEDRFARDEFALRDVREIRRAGELATGLTRRLLAFARRDVVNPRVLDVNAVVATVEGLLRRVLGEDVRLAVVLGSTLPKVCVDSGQLEQVLVNLAVNARDAMPNGGTLTLETASVVVSADDAKHVADATPGDHVVLRVTDTGVGMSTEVQTRIFEPFFTTKAAGQGTGLGLATCYGIVRHAGGHMRVSSQPGQGARFEVWLPAVEAEAQPSSKPPRSSVVRGNEIVLVVEDEPRIRRLVTRAVREQGYQVLEADNGVEALRVVESHEGRIDVVVTDVVMPEMGGRELALRIEAQWPGIGIIYTSGYAEGTFFQEIASRPDVHFLAKPYLVEILLERIRQVIDSHRRESSPPPR